MHGVGEEIKGSALELEESTCESAGERRRTKLIPGQYQIGRTLQCAVRIEDLRVAKVHCTITVAPDGTVTVQDHSRNGTTYVNGQRVSATPFLLMKWDRLLVGCHEFEVVATS